MEGKGLGGRLAQLFGELERGDPRVRQKLATEVSLNGMCSLATEAWVRGENFMQELPIVASDLVIGTCVCVTLFVLLAPKTSDRPVAQGRRRTISQRIRHLRRTTSRGVKTFVERVSAEVDSLPAFAADRGQSYTPLQRAAAVAYTGVRFACVGIVGGGLGQAATDALLATTAANRATAVATATATAGSAAAGALATAGAGSGAGATAAAATAATATAATATTTAATATAAATTAAFSLEASAALSAATVAASATAASPAALSAANVLSVAPEALAPVVGVGLWDVAISTAAAAGPALSLAAATLPLLDFAFEGLTPEVEADALALGATLPSRALAFPSGGVHAPRHGMDVMDGALAELLAPTASPMGPWPAAVRVHGCAGPELVPGEAAAETLAQALAALPPGVVDALPDATEGADEAAALLESFSAVIDATDAPEATFGVLEEAVALLESLAGSPEAGPASAAEAIQRAVSSGPTGSSLDGVLAAACVWAVFLAVSANVRYQLLCGVEQWLEGTPLAKRPAVMALATGALRLANNLLGCVQFFQIAALIRHR